MQCTSCDVDACMVLWFFQISSNDCFSFTRENFTSHNRWEKAAAWFERQNWFLRLCPFPIYGTRWDKRSLFERGRNKSGSSWPFLKPKVSYSHKTKQSVPLKMVIKPTFNGMLRWIIFVRTIRPVEATPPTMFSRIKEQAHKKHWHAQFTNVTSSFFSSCMIMMICSG